MRLVKTVKVVKVVKEYNTIKSAMRTIIQEIGFGHTEAVYQRALTVELMLKRVASMTEVPVPFFTRGVCVGLGRIDILTANHLIELKSVAMTKGLLARTQQQTRKYLTAMKKVNDRLRRGVLIVIDSVSLKVFIRFA